MIFVVVILLLCVALVAAVFFLKQLRNKLQQAEPKEKVSDDDEALGEEEEQEADHAPSLKSGSKVRGAARLQKRKMEKQRDKADRRDAQLGVVEARRVSKEAELEKESDHRKKQKMLQDQEEDALSQLRDTKRAEDDAKYKQWVGHIDVEERGEMGEEVDRHFQLTSFLSSHECVMEGKTLELEKLSRNFGISIDKVVAALEALVDAGSLDGIFDERGKFYVVSKREMQNLVKFVNNRGRVSMAEFLTECNKTIQL